MSVSSELSAMTATDATPFLTLGFAAVDWVEHYLVHGPGDVQGQPVELDDEFAAFVLRAYEVDARGDRKVRRAFLSRAKGRSKSGLAAMIACFEALGPCRFDHWAVEGEVSPWGYEYEPGEPVGRPLVYAEILNVATEEGQAGNTYDAIYYMLNPETCSPELLRDYGRIDVGITRTNLPGRRGFIEPVTSADSSKDGGKSTFIVADETHLWLLPRLKRLHGIMTRNLLKRKIASGWMLETSTMYARGDGSVAEGTHEYAKQVRSGRKRDRTLLFDHKQASDSWDLSKRSERMKALREAYGPAAAWMNLDAICDSWDDPQVLKQEFRRYWLNQPVGTAPKFVVVSEGEWTAVEDAGSVATDPTAIGLAVMPDDAGAVIASGAGRADGLRHVELIEPDPGLNRAGTGWLLPRLVEVFQRNSPCVLVVDPTGPTGHLLPDLIDAGFQRVKEPTDPVDSGKWRLYLIGSREYAQACGAFVSDVRNRRLRHLGQSMLTDAMEEARTAPMADAWKWSPSKSAGDITAVIAATLARHGHVVFGEMLPVAPQVWSLSEMVRQIQAERDAAAKAGATS